MSTTHDKRPGFCAVFASCLASVLLIGCSETQDEIAAQAGDGDDFEPILRQQVGEYTVTSSLTRSDALSIEIAERYGLPRSDQAAILNVAVRRANRNVEAHVEAHVTNLIEQTREIEMSETRANDRVAYMGIVDLTPRSALTVDLDILPVGETHPIELSYEHSFLPQTR